MALGADLAINPAECDAGRAIKEATGGKGVDVAMEISGVYAALQHAIRGVHKEGLGGHCQLLWRPGRPGGSFPRMASQPDHAALQHARLGLLAPLPAHVGLEAPGKHSRAACWRKGNLKVKPLIGARIPFEKAAEAYRHHRSARRLKKLRLS